MLIVNRILAEYLKQTYAIKREKYIQEYKSDFLIYGEKNIIVEAKGIIASRKSVTFSTVYCERTTKKLSGILNILKEGYEVQYFIKSY